MPGITADTAVREGRVVGEDENVRDRRVLLHFGQCAPIPIKLPDPPRPSQPPAVGIEEDQSEHAVSPGGPAPPAGMRKARAGISLVVRPPPPVFVIARNQLGRSLRDYRREKPVETRPVRGRSTVKDSVAQMNEEVEPLFSRMREQSALLCVVAFAAQQELLDPRGELGIPENQNRCGRRHRATRCCQSFLTDCPNAVMAETLSRSRWACTAGRIPPVVCCPGE